MQVRHTLDQELDHLFIVGTQPSAYTLGSHYEESHDWFGYHPASTLSSAMTSSALFDAWKMDIVYTSSLRCFSSDLLRESGLMTTLS